MVFKCKVDAYWLFLLTFFYSSINTGMFQDGVLGILLLFHFWVIFSIPLVSVLCTNHIELSSELQIFV